MSLVSVGGTRRRASKSSRRASKATKSAEAMLAELEALDFEERMKTSNTRLVRIVDTLKVCMDEKPFGTAFSLTRRRLPRLMRSESQQTTNGRRSPTGSPMNSLQAPRWVGRDANEFAKAMCVERIGRLKQEWSATEPSVRRVVALDDELAVGMALKTQDKDAVRLKVMLTRPLDPATMANARSTILRQLAPELVDKLGKIRCYQNGCVVEVIILFGEDVREIREQLRELGPVEVQASFKDVGELASRGFAIGGSNQIRKYAVAYESFEQLPYGANAGDDGGEKICLTKSSEEQDSLSQAIKKWDEVLLKNSHLWTKSKG